MSNNTVKTRAGDDPSVAERIRHARGEGRRRTIVLAVVASGLVSLFINNISETRQHNAQAERSRINCEFVNEDRLSIGRSLDEQSDNILGDMTEKDGDPDEGVLPFQFEGTPFEDLKPLSVAQARAQRERSRSYFRRVEDCNEVFPKRSVIPFIG